LSGFTHLAIGRRGFCSPSPSASLSAALTRSDRERSEFG
jgi:hypothetical protein